MCWCYLLRLSCSPSFSDQIEVCGMKHLSQVSHPLWSCTCLEILLHSILGCDEEQRTTQIKGTETSKAKKMFHRIARAIGVYLSQNSWYPKSSRSTLSRENTGGYHHDLTSMLNSTVNAVYCQKEKKKAFSFCCPLLSTDHIYLPSAGCFRATRKPWSSTVKRKWLNPWTMGALLQCLFFFYFFGSFPQTPYFPRKLQIHIVWRKPRLPSHHSPIFQSSTCTYIWKTFERSRGFRVNRNIKANATSAI